MREAPSGRERIARTTAPTSAPPSAPGKPARRDLCASLLVGLLCFGIYNANGRSIGAGDTYPARYLPFAIWRYHTLALDPIAPIVAQGRGSTAFWMVAVPGGPTLSLYPVVQPMLLAPLYLPAVAYLHLKGWTDARLDHVARVMEKLAASLVAALSAAFLFLLLRRRVTTEIALALTCAYAFGTTTWMISSQALWQHGLAELLGVGALFLLTAPSSPWRTVAVGFLLGLLAGNRPPDAIIAAALGAYALVWAGRRWPWLAAAAALPVGLVLFYNLRMAGNFAGAYGRMGRAAFFDHDLLSGLGGLLFSPGRGLFVFSPFLLLLAWVWRYPPMERGLGWAIGIAAVLQLLMYAKTDWRNGIYWGPRYMTDLLPLLVWMLAPVVASFRTLGRGVFGLGVGAAVGLQGIGAFWFVSAIDGPVASAASAWTWRNAPYAAALRHGPAPTDLGIEMQGSFDSLEVDGLPVSTIEVGEPVVAVGWALAGRATADRVAVSIDGHRTVASRLFYDRQDVREAVGETASAGWRIPLRTGDLVPGEHRLTAFAWATERGEGRYLGERTVVVKEADASRAPGGSAPGGVDLDAAAKAAAGRIREHQQGPGSWLTSYTSETRYETPRPEMNTFTTSLLVELLEPVAARAGLESNLDRARAHLTAQIEADGLVRYHGLPDGPGIGTLGCSITPDSDDTALVWRLAPARDRRRLETALATLEEYRTSEGLYRTWLAPRERYQCLDPGSDPNPADVAIQMHLMLLFAKERPAAARALCAALRPAIDQDRIWVYYGKAPLVPTLRQADLERVGCNIELPSARVRSTVAGQEVWTTVAQRLGGAQEKKSQGLRSDAESVLSRLAADDFAILRKDPPLLYHNDLSATVSRFYWSEDVGYALWLRIFDEFSHARRPGLR